MKVEITFVTPEERPLAVFGSQAGTDIGRLLEDAGITVYCSRSTAIPTKGTLVLHPGGEQIAVQRVVTLPVMEGRHVAGLPAVEQLAPSSVIAE